MGKGSIMKNIVLTLAVAGAMLFGSLVTPNTAEARPWGYRRGYYGGYYRLSANGGYCEPLVAQVTVSTPSAYGQLPGPAAAPIYDYQSSAIPQTLPAPAPVPAGAPENPGPATETGRPAQPGGR